MRRQISGKLLHLISSIGKWLHKVTIINNFFIFDVIGTFISVGDRGWLG